MLCFGGNWLVSGGVAVAKKFRISTLVIGMTVVAYGTSTPELAVSIAAATGGHGEIILGNIVGSNIANVGMVIGVAAILAPLAVQKPILRKEIPIMLGVSLLLVAISVDGRLTQHDGILLLTGLCVFAAYVFKNTINLMIMGVGAALGGIAISADVYVDYAVMILLSMSILIAIKTEMIRRTMGVCLAIGYAVYLATTFFR